MLKLDIKNIEKLYTDFIKKNLSDVDLTMEYVKILNNKLMKNTDFKAKFDFLNLIYVPRIGEVYLNLKKDNIIKHIKSKFKEHTFLDLDSIKTEENYKNDFINIILKDYNIIEQIKDLKNIYWGNALYVVTKKNDKTQKKYFVKINSKRIIYDKKYFESNIKIFLEKIKLIQNAYENNLTSKLVETSTALFSINNNDNSSIYYSNISISEYIEGIQLKEYILSNKFTEKNLNEIRELLKQLHNIGIFHGNITNENIMYDNNDNKFKFVNFSNAKTCEILSSNQLHSNLSAINTLVSYANPENIKIHIATFNLLKDKSIDVKL